MRAPLGCSWRVYPLQPPPAACNTQLHAAVEHSTAAGGRTRAVWNSGELQEREVEQATTTRSPTSGPQLPLAHRGSPQPSLRRPSLCTLHTHTAPCTNHPWLPDDVGVAVFSSNHQCCPLRGRWVGGRRSSGMPRVSDGSLGESVTYSCFH